MVEDSMTLEDAIFKINEISDFVFNKYKVRLKFEMVHEEAKDHKVGEPLGNYLIEIQSYLNRIDAIKFIRTFFGFSLGTAKEIIEVSHSFEACIEKDRIKDIENQFENNFILATVKEKHPSLLTNKEVQYGKKEMLDFVREISFARPYLSFDNNKAMMRVAKEFRNINRTPYLQGKYNNIVVGNPSDSRIIVGAHYDSVSMTLGADDNASALAVMMYIAANTKDQDICFVAFNAEENGLLGSKDFCQSLTDYQKVEQVHILEMVGYRSTEPYSQKNPFPELMDLPNIGNFIGAISNDTQLHKLISSLPSNPEMPIVSFRLPKIVDTKIVPALGHIYRSDHAPFWEKDIPAVMWTDTSEFRNPNYHKMTDTPGTLNYEFMENVGKSIIECIEKRS